MMRRHETILIFVRMSLISLLSANQPIRHSTGRIMQTSMEILSLSVKIGLEHFTEMNV